MEEGTAKPLKAYVFSCPNCGSPMHYDIGKEGMVCDSCGTTKPVQEFEDPSLKERTGEMDTVEFVCPKCGASIHTADGAASGYCSYCGSEVVLNARMTRMRRPDVIVPFRITREQCERYYRNHLQKFRFAPKKLEEQQTISHFQPIYIPFWNYTFTARGKTTGSGDRVYTDSSYRYTDELEIDVNVDFQLSSVLYDASSAFEDETALKLHFGVQKMDPVPFHPAYLCGVYTQAPDVTDDVYRLRMEPLAQKEFDNAFGQKTGTEGSCPLPPEQETTSRLVLMPVWLLTSREGDRVLYTAINGYTGKVICEPPVSGPRFGLLTVGMFCLLLAAFWLLQDFILRPNLLLAVCGLLSVAGMKRIVPRLDEILIRRQHDVDPTRSMKRTNPKQDVPLPKGEIADLLLTAKKAGNTISGSGCLHFFTVIVYLIIICSLYILFDAFFGNGSILNSDPVTWMISDRGFLAPALLLLAFIYLMRIKYTYPNAPVDAGRKISSPIYNIMLILLRVLAAAGSIITAFPVPAVGQWCYGLSVVILILLIVNLILFNRMNNEFVTRPVPILGKEVKA